MKHGGATKANGSKRTANTTMANAAVHRKTRGVNGTRAGINRARMIDRIFVASSAVSVTAFLRAGRTRAGFGNAMRSNTFERTDVRKFGDGSVLFLRSRSAVGSIVRRIAFRMRTDASSVGETASASR
jgi:hypothetical protein